MSICDIGGRFPSALNINRDSQVPVSPSSPSTSERDLIAAAGLPGSGVPFGESGQYLSTGDDSNDQENLKGARGQPSNYYANHPVEHSRDESAEQAPISMNEVASTSEQQGYHDKSVHDIQDIQSKAVEEHSDVPVQAEGVSSDGSGAVSHGIPQSENQPTAVPRNLPHHIERHDSQYGEWMSPAAATSLGGTVIGVAGVEAYRNQQQEVKKPEQSEPPPTTEQEPLAYPSTSSTQPIPSTAAWAEGPIAAPVLPVVDPSSPDDPFGSRRPSQNLQQTPLGSVGTYMDSTPEPRAPQDTLLRRVTEEPRSPINDPAAPIKDLADRPTLHSHASDITISHLHIPGGTYFHSLSLPV